MSTGGKLRAWRERSGLSQDQCAKRIGTGQRTWGQWELEESTPEVDYAAELEKMTDGAVTVLDWARSRRKQRKKSRAARAKVAAESSTDLAADAEHRSAS